MEKTYINAQELLSESFKLAMAVYESGYRPDYIVGVWRGGAPIGIAVQELMSLLGVESDHIAIRTSSYEGIGQRGRKVTVHGLNYLIKRVHAEDALLIVDDVFDTGLSVNQTIVDLKRACKKNMPEVRVATPYFKPANNKTEIEPDYYNCSTDKWLVFPHELNGLSQEEISLNKPEMAPLLEQLKKYRKAD